MESTTYRRRAAGRGSRTAGKQRPSGLSPREKRRLKQLLASAALFFAVFLGRGVLPGGAEAWRQALEQDLDLEGGLTFLEEKLAEGKALLDVFGREESPEEEPPSRGEGIDLPRLSAFELKHLRPDLAPGESLRQAELLKGALPVEEAPPAEEPAPSKEPVEEQVVIAVAQMYSESGEALPERVSLLKYHLGLEETAIPVVGTVTSGFGFRDHPVNGEYTFHTAIDVGASVGDEILAFADGTVRYIGENDVFGLYVKLDHANGVSTFYAHCEELLVKKGERVVCGQVIALTGETGNATGPHLHFSLEKDGIRLDPLHYLEL